MPSARRHSRRLLNSEQAADYLGRDVHFIYRAVRYRQVGYHKVGNRLLFDVADLDDYLASTRVEALPAQRGRR